MIYVSCNQPRCGSFEFSYRMTHSVNLSGQIGVYYEIYFVLKRHGWKQLPWRLISGSLSHFLMEMQKFPCITLEDWF